MRAIEAILISAAFAAGLASSLHAHPHHHTESSAEEQDAETSRFVGRYDGSEMELAMGMVIREDGTFAWGLTVGALDMRAEGTWEERSGVLYFANDRRPVSPEFAWVGSDKASGGPLIQIQWSTNEEPFSYGSVRATCANGERIYEQVMREGWTPPDTCDVVETVQLVESIYDVTSPVYTLSDFDLQEGDTIRFEFRPNDLGVADFTGASAQLDDGVLKIAGLRWPMELRKVN